MNNLPLLNDLRVFMLVARRAGFAAAAEELGVSPAFVSKRIALLEQTLNVVLLHRTTRRVSLTQDGMVYYERAKDLLANLDELDGMFLHDPSSISGRLRVDMPVAVARNLVIPKLPAFLQHYPGIELELSSSDRLVDVIREGFDCVVRVGTLKDSGLIARPLGKLSVINCASPDYLARSPAITRPEDLVRHERVAVSSGFLASHWCFERDGREVLVDPPSRFQVNNITCAREAAKAGLGLASLPAMLCHDELADGSLVALLPDWQQPKVPIYLLFPERRLMPRKLRVFIDFLVANGPTYGIDNLL